MKCKTFENMAKDVAKEAEKYLEVNDMPLEEFVLKVDEVAEFLKSEIKICCERLNERPSPYYNGVCVGIEESKKLNFKHIAFCQKLLNMMNFE